MLREYINYLKKVYRLKNYGIKLSGKIISKIAKSDSSGISMYTYLVQYNYANKYYTIYTSFSMYDEKKIGDEVKILSNPDNPSYAFVFKPGVGLAIFMIVFWSFLTLFFLTFLFLKSSTGGSGPNYP